MTKLENKSNQSHFQFYGGGCFFATAKKNAENAGKSYHFYKVIVVLHIYSKILGIRLVK